MQILLPSQKSWDFWFKPIFPKETHESFESHFSFVFLKSVFYKIISKWGKLRVPLKNGFLLLLLLLQKKKKKSLFKNFFLKKKKNLFPIANFTCSKEFFSLKINDRSSFLKLFIFEMTNFFFIKKKMFFFFPKTSLFRE